MNKITVKFITLGCKTNLYESEAMAELFRERGHSIVRGDEVADVCVINTCTVTGTGAGKSRQAIRRTKRKNPNAVIAVTGCFAQTEPEAVREIGADIIIGSRGKNRIAELAEEAVLRKNLGKSLTEDTVGDIMKDREYEELPITRGQSRIRANIKIEDGCDNFCAYCIIPYARGPVRSRPMAAIEAEARALADNGYREIVLTGIHIGSYGRDTGRGSLIDVAEALDKIDGIERIRLGSIEPPVVTDEFAERAAKLRHLCPQFHLSLQSGASETLKRMRRRYTPREYELSVKKLRENIPDTAITTDLMVGFPGETEDEFRESYEFCRSIGFMRMHIFKYSVRKGTAAETLPGRVSERVKEERAAKTARLAEEMKRDFCEKYGGKEVSVLLEQQKEDGIYHGTTPNYMDVRLRAPSGAEGQIVKALFNPEGESRLAEDWAK